MPESRSFPADSTRRCFRWTPWPERERSDSRGRLFNNFIWGGYLLHEWPEQRVFIDGGTDHYGDELFDEYIRVWNLDPGWREVLRRRGINTALVPPGSRLAHELVDDLGWNVWYCDSTAVILRGRADLARANAQGDSVLTSCSGPPLPSK